MLPVPCSLLPDPCCPVVIPDFIAVALRAREPRTAARQLLGKSITLALRIADRKMRHVEISNRPLGWIDRRVVDADAKEGDLIAEPAAVSGLEVAGVIPPLDLLVRMRGVVARKGKRIAGFCGLPRSHSLCPAKTANQERDQILTHHVTAPVGRRAVPDRCRRSRSRQPRQSTLESGMRREHETG